MRPTLAAAAAGLVLLGCAGPPARTPASAPADQAVSGYLEPAALERLAAAAPAAPAPGSPEALADHAASRAYERLEDTDRWRLAQIHAEMRPPLAMRHFDCPLGARLAQDPPPALTRLMTRTLRDAAAASDLARTRAFRARPVADDPARRACIRIDNDLRSSASHPAAPATVGSLWGMAFAELAPDQASALHRRGDEIGVSRAVCGLHYPADVAAGQVLARSLYEEIRQTPAYQADLAAAREELAQARALGRINPGCAAETRALDP